jgi:hypothetical protein
MKETEGARINGYWRLRVRSIKDGEIGGIGDEQEEKGKKGNRNIYRTRR